jgi:dienelactone hydrolase
MKTQTIDYRQGNTVLEGHLAWDDSVKSKRPGVLLFPDWTGVGPYAVKRAAMLVEEGYVVFCGDVYGKGIRPDTLPACIAEMKKSLNDRLLLRARARAALEQLRAHPAVDSGRIAAIGYCFGGLTAIELARDGAEVHGVVAFHANLTTHNPADAKNIKCRVLVLHGADDPVVPDAEVLAFEKEMRDAKVDWQLIAYGNTLHTFTYRWHMPPHGAESAYNEHSDRRSWIAMQNLFSEIF